MKELLVAIDQKRQEVEKLRDILQELSTAEEDLVALERTLKILGGNQLPHEFKKYQPQIKKRRASTSSLEIAKGMVREVGRPLHADEIVEKFTERGIPVRKESIVSAITKNIKSDNPEWVKVKPNTFDLETETPRLTKSQSGRLDGGVAE